MESAEHAIHERRLGEASVDKVLAPIPAWPLLGVGFPGIANEQQSGGEGSRAFENNVRNRRIPSLRVAVHRSRGPGMSRGPRRSGNRVTSPSHQPNRRGEEAGQARGRATPLAAAAGEDALALVVTTRARGPNLPDAIKLQGSRTEYSAVTTSRLGRHRRPGRLSHWWCEDELAGPFARR